MIRVSKKKQAEYMKAKRAKELALDNLDVAVDKLKKDGCDPTYCGMVYVQPKIDSLIKGMVFSDKHWENVSRLQPIPNCPDGRYRDE